MTTKNHNKPQPAYQRIKDTLLKNIHAGVWQAGDAIPTEHALAKQFNVSRMTVNRALKELSEERVLERRQGSGTFVAQQQFNHTVVEVRNIAEDIKANNKRYCAQVISKRRLINKDAPQNIIRYFSEPMLNPVSNQNAPSADENSYLIDEVKIIHFADDKPMQVEERWVNAKLVPDFINQDFSTVNTSDYLIKHSPLEAGSYTIRAVATPKLIAKSLNISEGMPALLLSRQTYSNGQVVTFVNMWHAGHDYQFSGTL